MAKRDSRILETTAEVMTELGGPARVEQLTGAAYKTVWQWSKDETFPARYFLVMWLELLALGFEAPPRLWGQGELPRNKEVLLATLARKLRGQAVAA